MLIGLGLHRCPGRAPPQLCSAAAAGCAWARPGRRWPVSSSPTRRRWLCSGSGRALVVVGLGRGAAPAVHGRGAAPAVLGRGGAGPCRRRRRGALVGLAAGRGA